jgi:hypothetical protein
LVRIKGKIWLLLADGHQVTLIKDGQVEKNFDAEGVIKLKGYSGYLHMMSEKSISIGNFRDDMTYE